MEDAQQLLNDALREQQAGRLDAARAGFNRILAADATESSVLAQVGQSLLSMGCHGEAEIAYRRLADQSPDDPEAQLNLGTVCAMQGGWDHAESAYRKALALNPRDPYARSRLALVILNQKRPEEAIRPLREALEHTPQDTSLQVALAKALCFAGRYDEHRSLVRDSLDRKTRAGQPMTGFIRELFSNPEIDTRDESEMLTALMEGFSRKFVPPAFKPFSVGERKLRVAYLSAYMRYRNYMGFVHEILSRHDRDRFDVRIYSDCDDTDPMPQVCGTGNLSNAALNQRIRSDRIDILVDLNGFAFMNRLELLAMKPSPVVVSWFNAYSTLGLNTVDYLIGDPIVSPPEEDRYYRERIFRLADCYLVRDINETVPPVSEQPYRGNGHVTFGTLAAGPKIHPAAIRTWSALLREVPGSRFILRNATLDKYLGQYCLDEFARHGIDPTRVELLGQAKHGEFLSTYDRIDIALDSFPWNGGTTTFEALWQGVPVVTFRGNRWVSRVGATIVNAAGFPEWVGSDHDDYVEIAVRLAGDPEALGSIRATMRQRLQSSILYDTAAFTRKLEAAFDSMVREKGLIR